MIVSMSFRSRLALLLLVLLIIGAAQRPVAAGNPRQDSYPAPTPTLAAAPTLDPALPSPTPLGYPSFAEPDFVAATPAPIGGEGGGQFSPPVPGTNTTVSQPVTPEATSRGLVFLWLSFLATFLVFLIAVVGSILLFTRRNEN